MAVKIKQMRNSKGHFLTVEQTQKVMAEQFVKQAQHQWKGLSWQSTKRFRSFENYIRNVFVSRKSESVYIKWDDVVASISSK